MDRKELKEIGISEELIDKVMSLHGQSIGKEVAKTAALQAQLDTKSNEVETLKTSLAQRDTDIAELQTKAASGENLSTQLTELKSKYETETTELKTKLESQAMDFEIDKLFGELKFSSNLAKNAAKAEFKAKGLKFSEGKFLGANDYLEELRKSDPSAFAVEADPAPTETEPAKPQFAQATPGGEPPAASPFNFNFHGVRDKGGEK